MNLEDYRTAFTSVGFVLMLIAASPILNILFPFSDGGERFSEIWVLGPTHMLEDYPLNVTVGEEKQVSLEVVNHMGRSAYYVVFVKFRNQTQVAPNSTTATPSSLAPLYEFRTVIADGATWEVPVFFSFLDASRFGDSFVVKNVSINGVGFAVDYSSLWDLENTGFFIQLFFELWICDDVGWSFRYHNRFVGLWLNLTG